MKEEILDCDLGTQISLKKSENQSPICARKTSIWYNLAIFMIFARLDRGQYLRSPKFGNSPSRPYLCRPFGNPDYYRDGKGIKI
jgi:hypothetical protein